MKGKVLGSALIVTGTAIGAGMLAIPIVTSELGFFLSTVLLFVCWGVMNLTAFLILHVNMAFKENSNLSTMASHTIGRAGHAITWVSCLMLLYALTAAYITGGASLLGHSLSYFFGVNIPSMMNAFLFTVVLGIFVYFGTRSVDYANRVLITLKMGSFFLMLLFLLPHVQIETLPLYSNSRLGWLMALPILITSFGYQNVIPNLRGYLQSNVKKLKKVILIGGSIPLVIYLFWELVIFGTMPELSPKIELGEMVGMLSTRLKEPMLSVIVNFFTDAAVTTSFLGVSMSLFHFIRDGFHLNQSRFGEKGVAALITFAPPLGFAWFYPKGFVMALNYASIFVVILLILIPVWMTLRLKRKGRPSAYPFKLHWTGTALLLVFSALVIGAQFLG
jgi:tyrosine-specific transport protein